MKKCNNDELCPLKRVVKNNWLDLSIYFGFLLVLIILIMLAVMPNYSESVTNMTPYSPIAVKLFGLEIRWYAIFILSGLVMAAVMAYFEFKRLGWDVNALFDGLLIIAPLAIIGARLYYVIFDPAGKPDSFIDVIAIWEGGLAIHGSIIVATIGVIIFSRKKKLNVLALADVLALGLLMGQIAGRWGNFMNAEAHGGETSNAFLLSILPRFIEHQMQFDGHRLITTGAIYQPTFLYESLWNLLGLTVLFVLRRKKVLMAGDMIGIYLIWYGLGRGVLVEPLRTDQLKPIFGVPVNILLSLLLFVGGGVLFLILKRVYIKDDSYYCDLATHDVFVDKEERKTVDNVN
ncbi:MAG: prolipoprotein diacylglyceryl transferase [Acholeplasma sp.]|nr:prolipoprotein diacylglyceryl transferase [Acholeplasma sp.]